MDYEDVKQYIVETFTVKVHPKNKGAFLASADITVSGIFRIKGFTIRTSKFTDDLLGEKVWVQPPKYPAGNGIYQPTVFIENEDLWNTIKKEIYSTYLEAVNN